MRTAAIAAAAMLAATAMAENFFVATVTDFAGAKSFSVVSKEEAKELELAIKRQNALLPKVLAEVQADFRKNPDMHAGEKYLGGKLKPKTVKFSQPVPDAIKAQEKADKMQEHEDNKDVEADKSKKKKRLSDSEKERAFKEAEREYAVQEFAKEVEGMIADKLEAAEAK